MGIEVGIILTFVAIIGWGFGDFLIQKSARKIGDWETLFIITFFGAVVLLPFIYKDIPNLFSSESAGLWILFLAALILFFAALLDFEALKRGKLDVVEPIWSLEIPISALLAFFILKESLSISQIGLIISLIIGLVLVSLRSKPFSKKIFVEKGVFLAIVAAILMGVANFFVGWGARVSDALMVNWFMNVFIMVFSFIFIIFEGDFQNLVRHIKRNKKLCLAMSVLDNSAWIAFASAMALTPIAVVVALSDSYIIIAVLLGFFVNKETLHNHQKLGLGIAIISAIVLASIT